MTSRPERPLPALSIAAAERDTGLSKDTLRIWERRYGFPRPERDALGERSYPAEQIEKLRIVRRLMEGGHRPGRVVSLPLVELNALLEAQGPARTPAQAPRVAPELVEAMARLKSHDVQGLRKTLMQQLLQEGLGRFVTEVVVPLNTLIGDAWMRGELEVFEEHLYTEAVQVVLRSALHHLPEPAAGQTPVVLLGTIPGEPHGLGLLMAEALFALAGCRCISLGVQTPVWDIVRAAAACRVDIVALSFTGCLGPNQVYDGLSELRVKLPRDLALWVGGSAPVLRRRPVDGVRPVVSLDGIAAEVRAWRTTSESHASA